MPSNVVQINCTKELEWYVGDSKMDNLMDYLDRIGSRSNLIEEDETTSSDVSS